MADGRFILRAGLGVLAGIVGFAVLAVWGVGKYDRKYHVELARDCDFYTRALGDPNTSLGPADRQWAAAYLLQYCNAPRTK